MQKLCRSDHVSVKHSRYIFGSIGRHGIGEIDKIRNPRAKMCHPWLKIAFSCKG